MFEFVIFSFSHRHIIMFQPYPIHVCIEHIPTHDFAWGHLENVWFTMPHVCHKWYNTFHFQYITNFLVILLHRISSGISIVERLLTKVYEGKIVYWVLEMTTL